jgi:hypothetical protein
VIMLRHAYTYAYKMFHFQCYVLGHVCISCQF